MTIHEALLEAQTALAQWAEANEAKLEAQLLMQHVLNVNRAWLIAHANDALPPDAHAGFELLLNRRLLGEPIAYILGYCEFYGLNLKTTSDTLIPRPDTETLVEAVLAKTLPSQTGKILDLGTGTGAVALAIASNRIKAQVTAVDASQAALNVAVENAKNLNISNIHFMLSDWFVALENHEKFDVIVSNPPYIEQSDAHLTQGDLRFEPMSALASGEDGLDDVRKIIEDCLVYLKPQGWLMLEHGYNQAEQVADLMAQIGLTYIETIKDLGGNHRVTMGKNPLMVNTHWD
ncbi:MAG: peptide chain release factor N(5)-glutamine methyltransferase [Methylotenera sp.]|nr:peptide chain release factor N(5)-glutamine methyltransferase [Methylotenera sp.]MDP1754478.1 peptide chain release factor N(5)-glutamine methyltransferase [Methylotenera sp.]MDP1958555.1 peptide chain release factor N(5)-glutamine methyltransferase [Methylotenera sp.]MDP3206989.1 peptide chain release factor N(5)-glutamine methyltransferase [Methylotenera sp.]MDP3303702.1 peptide chain release factor N(5)-glutamine methyltransferase [Methylotenera sp.]